MLGGTHHEIAYEGEAGMLYLVGNHERHGIAEGCLGVLWGEFRHQSTAGRVVLWSTLLWLTCSHTMDQVPTRMGLKTDVPIAPKQQLGAVKNFSRSQETPLSDNLGKSWDIVMVCDPLPQLQAH